MIAYSSWGNLSIWMPFYCRDKKQHINFDLVSNYDLQSDLHTLGNSSKELSIEDLYLNVHQDKTWHSVISFMKSFCCDFLPEIFYISDADCGVENTIINYSINGHRNWVLGKDLYINNIHNASDIYDSLFRKIVIWDYFPS